MSPLRRIIGLTGLLILGVVGAMLVAGTLTIEEAAVRAGAAMAAVVIVGRIIGGLVSALADWVERQPVEETAEKSEVGSPT